MARAHGSPNKERGLTSRLRLGRQAGLGVRFPSVISLQMHFAPWRCPKCGRTLQVKNQEHVCGLYDLESHFDRKDPVGRTAFDWLCATFEPFGEFDVLPMKTTIAFARGVNRAFLTTRRTGADISLVLARALASPRVTGSTTYSRTKTIYRIFVKHKSELDEELEKWAKEAQM